MQSTRGTGGCGALASIRSSLTGLPVRGTDPDDGGNRSTTWLPSSRTCSRTLMTPTPRLLPEARLSHGGAAGTDGGHGAVQQSWLILYRIVRQTSKKELNKRANLEIKGGQVELDGACWRRSRRLNTCCAMPSPTARKIVKPGEPERARDRRHCPCPSSRRATKLSCRLPTMAPDELRAHPRTWNCCRVDQG